MGQEKPTIEECDFGDWVKMDEIKDRQWILIKTLVGESIVWEMKLIPTLTIVK